MVSKCWAVSFLSVLFMARVAGQSCHRNLTFSPLPARENNVLSNTDYSAGTLGPYYSLPELFIDIVRPGPLPYGMKLL